MIAFGCYCADLALGIALGESLEFYGLEASPFAVNRRPRPARTIGEQMRRIDLGGKVLARVRLSVPVGHDARRLIERVVDSACERLEHLEPLVDRQDLPPAPTTTNPTRRPTGPSRPSSPTKTNPTRAIRSSRWNGKGVRS